jgi:predicted DNA-binding ribbon-helix-helix protein
MDRTIKKRTITLGTRKTSVSLEDPFYQAARDIAADQDLLPSDLFDRIDGSRGDHNLSSAIRVYVLDYYSRRCPEVSGKG